MSTELQIRSIGLLAFVFAIYSIWMGQMKVSGLPGGYANPILALELVKDGPDIGAIKAAESGKAIPFVRKQLYKDFGYIALYVLLFSGLSVTLLQTSVS